MNLEFIFYILYIFFKVILIRDIFVYSLFARYFATKAAQFSKFLQHKEY